MIKKKRIINNRKGLIGFPVEVWIYVIIFIIIVFWVIILFILSKSFSKDLNSEEQIKNNNNFYNAEALLNNYLSTPVSTDEKTLLPFPENSPYLKNYQPILDQLSIMDKKYVGETFATMAQKVFSDGTGEGSCYEEAKKLESTSTEWFVNKDYSKRNNPEEEFIKDYFKIIEAIGFSKDQEKESDEQTMCKYFLAKTVMVMRTIAINDNYLLSFTIRPAKPDEGSTKTFQLGRGSLNYIINYYITPSTMITGEETIFNNPVSIRMPLIRNIRNNNENRENKEGERGEENEKDEEAVNNQELIRKYFLNDDRTNDGLLIITLKLIKYNPKVTNNQKEMNERRKIDNVIDNIPAIN